ncbi:MAG: DUF4129 domain-containing protein [Actinomyces sp.]|nr:MAG: DUF4129 domain-containing protein [Actinomyces sp.]
MNAMSPRAAATAATESAIAALVVVLAIGFERLFVDRSYLPEVLVLGLGGLLVALVTRRSGLGPGWSLLVSAVGLVVTTTVLFHPETAALVVPTGATLDAVRADLSEAWAVFGDVDAPAPVVPGFVLVAGSALWIVAALTDWAALRLRSPIESLVPATTLFAFTAVLGVDEARVGHAVAFAIGAAALLLGLRTLRQAHEEVWVAGTAARGVAATLRTGVAAGGVAVLVGALVGPSLPGAGSSALVDLTELDNGPSTRVVVSPLVEVQASLVQQAPFELFSVAVDDPVNDRDYWRLMALTEFDGHVWRRSSNFDDVRGPVPSTTDPGVGRRLVRQRITTTRLANIYLPVAYELRRVVDDGGIGLEYEAETGSLVVTEADQDRARAGFTYVVESAVPDYDPARLAAISNESVDPGFLAEYTQLPDDLPPAIADLAHQITDAYASPYDKALAIQQHFHSDTFSYSLDVALRHDIADLEDFLFIVQQGYCEQFSSAFATLARAVGLPTRVAVGFTWGDWDPDRGEYVVRGEHAHAWPEVWFDGVGWVRFEPTPGRGAPHDTAVTGLPPAQQGFTATGVDATTTIAPPTTASGGGFVPPTDGELQLPDVPLDATGTPGSDTGGGAGVPLRTAGLVLAVAALLVGTAPTLRLLRRRRRRLAAGDDPRRLVEAAWDEALEALRLVDVEHRPTETPLEFAHRVEREVPGDVGPVDELASVATLVRYGPEAAAADAPPRAAEAAAGITERCETRAGRLRVVLDRLDPRRLF